MDGPCTGIFGVRAAFSVPRTQKQVLKGVLPLFPTLENCAIINRYRGQELG
jgi:uncharacterized membrane protein (GlpM family)